jgi:hypothetical protein
LETSLLSHITNNTPLEVYIFHSKPQTKMSPIIASQAARAFTRATGRRQFSMINSLRSFARSFEHAPFQRMPQTQQSAASDWGRQFKRAGGSAMM